MTSVSFLLPGSTYLKNLFLFSPFSNKRLIEALLLFLSKLLLKEHSLMSALTLETHGCSPGCPGSHAGPAGLVFPFCSGAAPELIEKSAMFACVVPPPPPPLCPLSLLPSDISSLSQQMGALKVSAEGGPPRGVRSLGNWSPGMALWDGEGKACRVSIRDHAGGRCNRKDKRYIYNQFQKERRTKSALKAR